MTCCVPPCVQCDCETDRQGESDGEQETDICEKCVCMTCCVPPCVQCDCETDREKGESDGEQETDIYVKSVCV